MSMASEAGANWVSRAACAGADPDLFHPQRGMPTSDAKAVCATCPVRTECLAWAVRTHQKFGIWGGLSERERRRLVEVRPDLGVRDPRTCPCCGDRFIPRQRHQRFCTADCRNYHRNHVGAAVTGYELRRHLAADHGLELRGLVYEDLVAIHDDDHEAEQGHDHGEVEEADG